MAITFSMQGPRSPLRPGQPQAWHRPLGWLTTRSTTGNRSISITSSIASFQKINFYWKTMTVPPLHTRPLCQEPVAVCAFSHISCRPARPSARTTSWSIAHKNSTAQQLGPCQALLSNELYPSLFSYDYQIPNGLPPVTIAIDETPTLHTMNTPFRPMRFDQSAHLVRVFV